MDEEDETKYETYVVGALGDVHATWRMKGFKMSVDAATWGSKNALKMRLEEEKKSLIHSPIWERFFTQNIKSIISRTQAILL